MTKGTPLAKRPVTTEIKIAALSAAIELVARPEYNRGWLKEEFADETIKAVRVTEDIVDAVEEAMTERLARFTKILKAELDELLASDDEPDEAEELAEQATS